MVKKTHRIKTRNKGNKRNKSSGRKYLKKTKKRIYRGGKKLTPSEENADAIPVKTPDMRLLSSDKGNSSPQKSSAATPDMRLLSSDKDTSPQKSSAGTPALNDDQALIDLERRLALLKQDDLEDRSPVVNSPFHIPEYKKKSDEQNSRLKSPNFESQDAVLSETYDKYKYYTSKTDDEPSKPETPPLPSSFQVMGYDKHPFFSPRSLPDMTDKKLPILKDKINITVDAHGSVGHILNDNEKRLANHYLRIIEVGDYDGTVTVYEAEYYKVLNDMLRNPSYVGLFDDTHIGKQLRIKAYNKLCRFIKDSRKPRCVQFSYNKRGDDYFKLIHLTHDRSFSGDKEDIDIRENHPVTARTLVSFEHQGIFVPLPYNRDKTGMPYYTKEMFQLLPGTMLMSRNTKISLIDNILPLAIERNQRFNIFISSCNVSFNLMTVPKSVRDKSGISEFISTGKNFLFLISNLSQNIPVCVKFLYTQLYKGRETAHGINSLLDPDNPKLTPEIVDTMDQVLICLRNGIFMKNYGHAEIHKYNAYTVPHYFLGSIIPNFKESYTVDMPNELENELNNPNPFDTSENPKLSELYTMARLYLIQELVDNLGTSLELAVSMLSQVNKLYDIIIYTIQTNHGTNLLTPAEVALYGNYHSYFLALNYFLEYVYDKIYIYYLPKLQNDKNNNKPQFRKERFINKPLYNKFLKLYKTNSLFFEEQTDFMHKSSTLENVNPYKYKQRVNVDDVRDRMPDKDKFLSDNKLLKNSNNAKTKMNVSV